MDKTIQRIYHDMAYIARCIFIFVLVLLGSYCSVSAKTMISDSAGYLTSEEAAQIENTCDYILKQYKTSVFIITTEKMGKSDSYQKYVQEQAKKAKPKENLVILFVSTKKNDNICYAASYGAITSSLTEGRMAKMAEAVEKRVESESYYQAIDIFCNDVIMNLNIKPSLDGFIFQPLPQLLLSLLIGCGVVFYLLYPGKKKQVSLHTYLDREQSRNLGHLDHFSHREVNILKNKKKDKTKEEDSGQV